MLVTYFKFNPLGLEFGKPDKSILFPHLGLIKNESQWFSGYPVRPPRFSSHRRHGYIRAERIHVRIPGHTGQIPGSYLHDKSRHLSFVAMTQLENYISQPCLTESIYAIFWVILFNFSRIPPDGSNQCFVGDIAKVPCFFFFCRLISIGCATALPMGVAPKAIAEIFGYRLKRIDKFAPRSSSRIICWFCSLLNGISFYFCCKPPSRRQGKPVRLPGSCVPSDPFVASHLLFFLL
jgi:hypothetical protein